MSWLEELNQVSWVFWLEMAGSGGWLLADWSMRNGSCIQMLVQVWPVELSCEVR